MAKTLVTVHQLNHLANTANAKVNFALLLRSFNKTDIDNFFKDQAQWEEETAKAIQSAIAAMLELERIN